jgi:hypothetical protein
VTGVEGVAPRGYRIILPPGWARIPLREGTDATLEELVYSRLRTVPQQIPRDRGMRYRMLVRRTVEEQVAAARGANGLDLYLPVRPRHRTLVAASFLVSEVVLPEGHGAGVAAVGAGLAGTGVEVRAREVAGGPAVRREYVRRADPGRKAAAPAAPATRHVEYALPVPHDPRRFLAVAFSTAGDGVVDSEFTTAVVELFDALMTTFRWAAPVSVRPSGSP